MIGKQKGVRIFMCGDFNVAFMEEVFFLIVVPTVPTACSARSNGTSKSALLVK